MNNLLAFLKANPIISGAAVALAILLLTTVIGTFGVVAIIAAILGGALTAALIARSRGENPSDVIDEAVSQIVKPSTDSLIDDVEENLLQLSLDIRHGCLSVGVTKESDKLIDLLKTVVPRALAESADSEASYNLMKVATDFLPDVVNKYIATSPEDRASEEADLLKQLTDAYEMVSKAEDSLNSGSLSSFQVSNAFLKIKTL